MFGIANDPLGFFIRFLAIIFGLTIHEFAHGYVAYLRGDGTAKAMGRLTLNPLKHLDLIGTIMLFLGPIGWAKPVPINPAFFKKPRQDLFLVSIAGISANLTTAFILALVARFVGWEALGAGGQLLVINLMGINLALSVFNLIPLPPLDGSKVLASLLPARQASAVERFNPLIGTVIILGVMMIPPLRNIVFGIPLNFLFNILLGVSNYGGL
ncbi:MAG: site-2 protease family protein [Candidatus Firestonebacteria bacterium]